MDPAQIDSVLAECERALARDPRADLRNLGFWRAVAAVKRRSELRERYAAQIAEIDRRSFLARTLLVFPIGLGVAVLALGTLAGVALLAAAFALAPDLAGIAILLGTAALLGATHDLAHIVVGGLAGIRFTHWFSDPPKRPQPGVKLDYASYLAVPARKRAWMHASGAIVTKLVPFLVVPVALAAGAPWWTSAILLVIGVVQILTDVLFSVRFGDWKKFRREMRVRPL